MQDQGCVFASGQIDRPVLNMHQAVMREEIPRFLIKIKERPFFCR